MDNDQITLLTSHVISQMRRRQIPLGISNRHAHLSATDYQRLFPRQPLTVKSPLLQPGQFASEQTITLKGPKGEIGHVRVLGPLRERTQVEISRTDARSLGIKAPLRLSGDLAGSAGLTLVSDVGEVVLDSGVIVAHRHIHMSPLDAAIFGVRQGENVKVEIAGSGRKLIFDDVCIRIGDDMRLEMHIDTDEANAADIGEGQATATLLPMRS